MANRYGALTLQLKQLSTLADIGSAHINVLSATGMQKISETGSGSFTIPRDYSAISAIDSNIGQVAYVYLTDAVASGAAMDVATFIIKDIDRTTDPSGMTVTVRGDGLTDQLTYTDLDDNTIDDGAGNKDTSDIDSIMGYAPSGWTYNINGGAGTGSSNGSYFTSRGNNVLQLLIAASKQNSGDTFRLNAYSPPSKVIRWNTTADSSGVTLRMPSDPTTYDGSTTVGIILNMSEDASFEDVVTRIRPYGAGLDDGRLDITDIDAADTGGDPAGYTTTFASNLIVNTTLETSLGYSIKRDKDFSQNRAADVTDATQLTSAAVALWNEGITYLQERDSSKVFYRVQCVVAADLRPGQTVTIVYDEYEGGITGGSAVWSINGAFYIHQVTNSVTNSGDLAGVRVTSLVVSDTIAPKATGGRILASALQTVRETTRKSNALTTPGAVPTSTAINTALPLTGGGDFSANRTHALGSLSSYGTANQVLGSNATATDIEYKTVTAGDGVDVTHGVGSITVAVDVTDILGNGLTETTNNIVLGTPSSITSTSTNSVGASTHTHAVDSTIALTTDLHSAVTLGADTAPLFSIGAGQILTFDVQTANTILAGPVSGAAADPTMRALVYNDLPIGAGLTSSGTNLVLGTPTTLTVSTTNTVSGTTHAHAITTSSAVSTATAVILASDSNGRLRLQGLAIGQAPANDALEITKTSGSPAVIIEADTNGEFATPTGQNMIFGHWTSGTSTFTERWRMGTGNDILYRDAAVAHGMTTEVETSVYGKLDIFSSTAGGVGLFGYSETDRAILVLGAVTTDETTKSASGSAAIDLRAYKKSGTTVGAMGTNANLVVIRDSTSTRWIVDKEGDTYRDGTDNTFDAYDDVQLARAFDVVMAPDKVIKNEFDNYLKYNQNDLIAAGILSEGGFYNESQLLRLHNGALWQEYTRRKELEARVEKLERLLTDGTKLDD